MVQEKRRGKRSPRELVRREPPDDPAEAVERLISRRQLIVEPGDMMIVREPAGVFRQRTDLSTLTNTSNSQYRLSVHGQAIAAARRVRLFYVEDAALTLLKDYRPATKH